LCSFIARHALCCKLPKKAKFAPPPPASQRIAEPVVFFTFYYSVRLGTVTHCHLCTKNSGFCHSLHRRTHDHFSLSLSLSLSLSRPTRTQLRLALAPCLHRNGRPLRGPLLGSFGLGTAPSYVLFFSLCLTSVVQWPITHRGLPWWRQSQRHCGTSSASFCLCHGVFEQPDWPVRSTVSITTWRMP
jgi:hypothetical protein